MAQGFLLTDVVGFRHLMRDALDGKLGDAEMQLARTTFERFCDNYASLDRWKIRNERTAKFQPGQPCLHRGSPCVVVGCSPTRVMVNKWVAPSVRLDHAVSPVPRWLDPNNIDAITTNDRWSTWKSLMHRCGVEYEEWTTMEFRAAMELLT